MEVNESLNLGKTKSIDESVSDENLDIQTLVSDFVNLLIKIFLDSSSSSKAPSLLVSPPLSTLIRFDSMMNDLARRSFNGRKRRNSFCSLPS